MKLREITIVCFLDGTANSTKSNNIIKYLQSQNLKVNVINTLYILRTSVNENEVIVNKKPIFNFYNFCLYLVLLFKKYLEIFFAKNQKIWFYRIQKLEMTFRGKILHKIIMNLNQDIVIGESLIDLFLFKENIPSKTFFDSPTPFSEEEYYGDLITTEQYKKLFKQELSIYNNVDYLSFHWKAYKDYVEKNYNYSNKNLIVFDGGCDIQKTTAKFSSNPKIIYLGYLGGYWINLDLLSRLNSICPNIEVYGMPMPDKNYNLNYKGYSKPHILPNYQFGLITITKDRLRREGYSAKHLEYLSYGLPVLVPDWRTSTKNIPGTIHYNEDNFLEIIKEYSDKKKWEKVSKEALEYARTQTWDKTLKPLEEILK